MKPWLNKFFRKKYLPLITILISGSFFRVVDLGVTPEGLHADEASFLLNAETMRETLRDEDNRLLPLTLNSLIDPKPALYSYLQIPFVSLLGSNAASARLPAAAAGVISLWLAYRILYEITKNRRLALLAALLLAISPWHIIASRATQEVIFSFTLVLAAVLMLLQYFKKYQWQYLVPLALFSWLAMYFYHASKVFLFSLVVIWLGYNFINKKTTVKQSLWPFLVLGGSLAAALFVQESSTRFTTVGFLSNQEPQIILDNQIMKATGQTPGLLIRAFYNKVVFYGRSFLAEYANHFSFDFLFLNGGEPKRYYVPFHGLLYIIELPLILAGMAKVWWQRKSASIPLFIWLVLAPLPAALTFQETPSLIRALPMVLPLAYFAAEGLVWIIKKSTKFTRPMLVTIILLSYLWSTAYFWQQYSVQQKIYEPWHRNTPYSDIASELTAIAADYDRVLVTNDLRPLYAYFALEGLISTQELQAHPLERNNPQYQLGKYEFNQQFCNLGSLQEGTLYIVQTDCRINLGHPAGLKLVKLITYPDNLPVYELLEYQPLDE